MFLSMSFEVTTGSPCSQLTFDCSAQECCAADAWDIDEAIEKHRSWNLLCDMAGTLNLMVVF